MLRLISDEQARQRWGPVENPYAAEPGGDRTFAYQQIELENAVRQLKLAFALAVLPLLRRLPFCS
jgi:hypothetical protein